MVRWAGWGLGLVAAGIAAAAVLVLVSLRTEQEFDRLLAAGDAALAQADLSTALEAYTGAVTLKSDAMVAYLKRGVAYRQREELEAALRDFRRAGELDNTAPRVFEWQGDVNLALQRFARAADCFTQSLALDDRQPAVLYKLGVARYRDGRAGAAVEPLRRAVALSPRLAEAHYLLGVSLRDAGRDDEALVALGTAARLSPGMLAAREVRAEVLLAHGRLSRAIDDLEALAALEPDRPERAVALGLAQARAGRREAAIMGLGQAAERFPQSAAVYRALGQVWMDGAEDDAVVLDKAIAALARAATLPDVNADVRTLLARARLRRGDVAGAERDLRAATERLPVPSAAFRLLGDVLERRRQWTDARDAFVHYAALTAGSAGAADVASHIGQLSMRIRDPHTAAYWYEKALAEAGPSADLLFRLATAESSRGATAAARDLVARGLALEPAHAGLRALARSLG